MSTTAYFTFRMRQQLCADSTPAAVTSNRFALTYLHELPDFVCEQTSSTSGGTVFKAQVTFENGHEHYSDITINGKPYGESSLSGEGLMFFSSGELGTNLVDLFTSPVVARFRFRMQAELRNVRAWVYSFKIPAGKNTFWAIRDDSGAILHPEYKGELWLEHPNGRLLRLELQPVHLPKYFGIASAQTTIDYNEVHIVDAGLFLLPSKSETTACTRNLSETICTTNVLTFQDCRKFGTKTRILYR